MRKFWAIGIIGIILCGCKGPQIQKAIDAISADIDTVSTQILAGEPLLTTVADLEKQALEPKLSKGAKDTLLIKIGETHSSIATVTALKTKITAIRDSLRVIEEKATGKVKEENIPALNAKLDDLFTRLTAFTNGSSKLDELKATLEKVEEKTPEKKKGTAPSPKSGKVVPLPPKKK